MITHRSKVVQYQRCPRSRYWLGERELERNGRATPLVTGGAVHAGLAGLLVGEGLETALESLGYEFRKRVEEHGLTESLELIEQEAMAEALVRVAHKRIIPRLLTEYEVLEVERPDSFLLEEGLTFAFCPDALLRNRVSGDLVVLSWKTAAAQPREEEVRVDMQGITEAYGVTQLRGERVVGVQMGYLIKGRRSEIEREGQTWKKFDSPLVWAWENEEGERAAEFHWRCTAPHPMKKNKRYYPDGMCQGGRRHERGGSWKLTQIMPAEVEGWVEGLPEETLDKSWALPTPIFRPEPQLLSYMNQVRHQEHLIKESTLLLGTLEERLSEEEDPEIREFLEAARSRELDKSFPQTGTAVGCKFYGALCPAYELCFGPAHVAKDPLGSGNYRKREPLYQIEEAQ